MSRCWAYEPSQRPAASQLKETLYEILQEERHTAWDTMQRENRRVTASSYGDDPPPKPSRPHTNLTAAESGAPQTGAPQTYIVAQNPLVLAHLLRENQSRALDPQAYTTPASSPEFDTEQAVERRLLAELARQQHQSEEDRRWLQMQEDNLKKRISTAPVTTEPETSETSADSTQPLNKPSSQPHSAANSTETSPANTVKPKERTPSEDGKDQHSSDPVYSATTSVVRAVMRLSSLSTCGCTPAATLAAVRAVGAELRVLCATVDTLVAPFPHRAQREVEMAHQVLSKDMAALVEAMRLAIQYANTTLHHEYTKSMLAAAHVLAMDAKNLLDVVDCIRERHPTVDWRSALKEPDPHNQVLTSQNQVLAPQNQTITPQNQTFTSQNPTFTSQDTTLTQNPVLTTQSSILSNQSSIQEDDALPPKPDFKINQPVTTSQLASIDHLSKEHSSLPTTSNRVSTLIHNYNLYGNVREPQHIYGNTDSMQSSSSITDESKIDSAPMESVKNRVQALAVKLDSPPIYSVSKKMIPLDQNSSITDQG